MQSKYNSMGNFFIKWETINSTSRSSRVAAKGWDLPTRSTFSFFVMSFEFHEGNVTEAQITSYYGFHFAFKWDWFNFVYSLTPIRED